MTCSSLDPTQLHARVDVSWCPAASAADSLNRRRASISQPSTAHRRHRRGRVRRMDRARVRPARRPASRSSTPGARATRAPAPAARRASSARPTARARSTRGWRFERWSCGGRTTPSAASCTRPACCGCSATTTASAMRRRRCCRDHGARLDVAGARRSVAPLSPDRLRRHPLGLLRAGRRLSLRAARVRGRRRARASPKAESIVRPRSPARSSSDGTALTQRRPGGRHASRRRRVRLRVRALARRRCFPTSSAPASLRRARRSSTSARRPATRDSRRPPCLCGWTLLPARDRVRSTAFQPRGSSGFKVADDAPGPAIDPTSGDREVSADGVARARAFLSRRFPALADAPLVGSEVCQYESTPDDHFIVDRHPRAANVWIVGGGSGHGFKMGPAVGEMVASLVLGRRAAGSAVRPGAIRVRRRRGGWEKKWS